MTRIPLMINGIPGNVAGIIFKHALSDPRISLIPYSLTGPDVKEDQCKVGTMDVALIKPGHRAERIRAIQAEYGPFITVDYTHPTAVNSNVEFYCGHRLPFVMGTTGGDREGIRKRVLDSDICAVISPNMAKQIVGLMAMVEYGARTFPDLFKGYTMEVRESHQSWKADTSGTAKAMIRYFNQLGVPYTEDDIHKERDPEVQKKVWKIPEQYLDGHGWHTYTLTSADKTAQFSVTHNISGREIYGEGTLDAVVYLQGKIEQGVSGAVFSMIDVLTKS